MRENAERRKFLGRFLAACASALLATRPMSGQETPRPHRGRRDGSAEDDAPGPDTTASRKSALEENEKDVKKKVEKLFKLATELKEEVDKTDAVKVLSVAMLKKTEEIEKLAKDIRSRAKG